MPDSAYASTSFRDSLKQRMEEKGWSQSQLSKRSGVSQPQISRMLSGKTKRFSRTVEKLCKYAELPLPQMQLSRDQDRAIQQEVKKLMASSPKKIETIIALLRAASALAEATQGGRDSSAGQG